MLKLAQIVCLSFILAAFSISNAPVKAESVKSSTLKPNNNDSERVRLWFAKYDDIRKEFEPTDEGSYYFLGSTYDSLNSDGGRRPVPELLLTKYRIALQKLKALPTCEETKLLSKLWLDQLNQAYAFCAKMQNILENKKQAEDKENYLQKLFNIDKLSQQAIVLDSGLRAKYRLTPLHSKKHYSLFAFGEEASSSTVSER